MKSTNKLKKYSIIIIPLFILLLIFSVKYYLSIKIYEPINIYVSGLNITELNSTNFNAITPFNRSFKIKVINDKSEISINKTIAFYKNIELTGIDSILSKIKQIRIKIGATSYLFENEKIKKEWKIINREKDLITYQAPNYIRNNISPIIIIKSLLEFRDLLIVVTFLILISVIFIFYKSISQKILKFIIIITRLIKPLKIDLKCWKVKTNLNFFQNRTAQLLTIIILIFTYILFFFNHFNFSNDVQFNGDEIYHQSMAVNFIKGHGYPKVGGYEKFEEYKFILDKKDEYSIEFYKNSAGPYSFSKHPVYPLFVAFIYFIFGINPIAVKYIQLIMIIIVSAFLPWLGYKFWNKKGFISGLIASPVFIINNCNFVSNIFTEPLIVFTIFLIILAYLYYKQKNTIFSISILGIILGFGLLLKGSLIFIPALVFIYLIRQYRKNRQKKILIHASLIVIITILTVLPWTIYANIKNQENVIIAKKGLEVLLNKNLSDEAKLAYINNKYQDETEVISMSENPNKKNSETDKNIIKRKIVLQKIYLKSNSFFIFSTQSPTVLFDGNSDLKISENDLKCSDGGIKGWFSNKDCYYYHDNMEDSPPILRVINFYCHFPNLFFKITARKVILSFFRLNFLWIILYLFVLESILNLISKYVKNRKINKAYHIFTLIGTSGILYFLFQFNPPIPTKNSFIFYMVVFLVLVFSTLINFKSNFKDITLCSPDIFNIIFINFLLITLVIFGFERQSSVINFILTLTAIYYLLNFIEKIKKGLNRIEINREI